LTSTRGNSLLASLRVEDFLFLGAVVFLPWAFGGVETWAHRSAAALVAYAGTAALAREGWRGLGLHSGNRWLLPAFLLGAYAFFQILPLPPAVLRTLSATADRIYRETFPGYPGPPPADPVKAIEESALARVPEALGKEFPRDASSSFRPELGGRWTGWRALSVWPGGTSERLFWYLALLIAFLFVQRRCQDPGVEEMYRAMLFLLFACLAIVGLIQTLTWNEKLLWIRPLVQTTQSFGPYVNPTHFAGVMEMAVPWLAGYGLHRFRRAGWGSRNEARGSLALLAALLCLVAGFIAASRFAAIAMGTSVVMLVVIASRGWRQRLAVALVSLLVAATAAGVMLGTTYVGARARSLLEGAEGSLGDYGRIVLWRAGLAEFEDFPLLGAGFGSFRQVFQRYVPEGDWALTNQLHNDYLEVLVDGGAAGFALVIWLAWSYIARLLRSSGEERTGYRSLSRSGLLLGLASLSVHAFVDFNHQIPANALIFVTLAAIVPVRTDPRVRRAP